ncbi:MAG: hypothetical protein Q4E46_02350 [Candidatus Saccharibacteria bacterium]|nr:hypothetical protein [Candidatus Saccharibacteria bacterium]
MKKTNVKKVVGRTAKRVDSLFNYVCPEHRKQVKVGVFTALGTVAFIALLLVWNVQAALRSDYSDKYTTNTREGEFTIVVDGGTNVRTEPLAAEHHIIYGLPGGYVNENYSVHSDGVNNVIGTVADRNSTGAVFHAMHYVEVTESWWDDYSDGDVWNGPYIGLVVSELSKEELKLLPRKAVKDPDGIVWISSKHLTIY